MRGWLELMDRLTLPETIGSPAIRLPVCRGWHYTNHEVHAFWGGTFFSSKLHNSAPVMEVSQEGN